MFGNGDTAQGEVFVESDQRFCDLIRPPVGHIGVLFDIRKIAIEVVDVVVAKIAHPVRLVRKLSVDNIQLQQPINAVHLVHMVFVVSVSEDAFLRIVSNALILGGYHKIVDEDDRHFARHSTESDAGEEITQAERELGGPKRPDDLIENGLVGGNIFQRVVELGQPIVAPVEAIQIPFGAVKAEGADNIVGFFIRFISKETKRIDPHAGGRGFV